jgi:3-hydroxyisobutyrate dehydrogenase
MKIAVLGTGTMGGPIARNLAKAKHTVRVWNRTSERAQRLGAEVFDNPADSVAGADAVITMLSDGPSVEKVAQKALQTMEPGGLWLQMSTVGIASGERLAALGEDYELLFVDAPVLGSKEAAEKGTILVLAAGPRKAHKRAEELLAPISRGVIWVGVDPTAGQRLKLVVNGWITSSIENLAETIAFAQALGVQPKRFLEAIEGGALDMGFAQSKGKDMLAGSVDPQFKLSLAHKDVGLILEAAKSAGLDLPLARATYEQMGWAIDLGHGEEDMAAVYYASRPSKS